MRLLSSCSFSWKRDWASLLRKSCAAWDQVSMVHGCGRLRIRPTPDGARVEKPVHFLATHLYADLLSPLPSPPLSREAPKTLSAVDPRYYPAEHLSAGRKHGL